MSYLGRVWMAASVAVVQGHTDPTFKWNTGLKSLQLSKRGFSSSSSSSSSDKSALLRPFSAGLDSEFQVGGGVDGVMDRRQQNDESLQKVMYMNCWGQS